MTSLVEKLKYHLFSIDDSGDVGVEYHGSFTDLDCALTHVIDDELTQSEIWENKDDGALIVTHKLLVDSPTESFFDNYWKDHNWNRRWEKVVIIDDKSG